MKQYEFDPIAEGRYRDMMLEQYQECRNQRPKTDAQKRAAQAGSAPKKLGVKDKTLEPLIV